ncbi:hypothetical protein [Aureibacter tunicatorum]|uniref:Uncharacterized protein n=1 Tax=Aureibacter tunicatorum TaxID=866807 RepID=A0AAE4BSD8_9BACT|nr:hypothetical protein [Aureibacter tunicatorum]MDR6241134.1 hypothetical protein [Aureibacter tunicatorum]BDD03912.1 hypothetical protein AUTU_13950 [Aureibacter tunicatorum]
MEEFRIESKGSTIGLIIKIIVFSLVVNQAFNLVEKFIGQNSVINWILILGTVVYFIYGHFTDKTILEIKNNKVLIESLIGFPKKHEILEFDLNNVEKIRLVQSQDFVYGKKTMELIDQSEQKQIVELKLRYYQLVRLEEYLKGELKIETSLIG